MNAKIGAATVLSCEQSKQGSRQWPDQPHIDCDDNWNDDRSTRGMELKKSGYQTRQNFCRNFLPADLVGSPRKHHLSFEDPCLIPLEGEYTYIYIHIYIHTYIHIYNYIYISWDWLILPQNWKWPWVCGSKIISSWPYWGKPPIIFHQFPIDSVLDIFHGQNGRKTEPSQSEASYIVDDCTYPQYILTISSSGIGPNPHHIPNDHRSLHELPLFTTQPRAQRGPLVNYLATACGGDQNILGYRIKHPSPQL